MTEQREQDMKTAFFGFGIILVIAGLLFFLHNFIPGLRVGRLWPLFMLIPVVILIGVWIHGKEKVSGVVMPIIILVFFTVYFLWLNFNSWAYAATTWPNFLIGPGLGFLGLFFTSRKWGFLIPAFILLALGAIFYAEIIGNTYLIGILLIIAGLFFIARPLLNRGKPKES